MVFTIGTNPRSKNCSMANFAQVSKLLSAFYHFWTRYWNIRISIEWSWRGLPSDLSMLYCKSLQKHIFRAFCNNFESHYCICMFAHILLKSSSNIVGPSMTSQANLPHSLLLLSHGAQKELILKTSKIHGKLTKLATNYNNFFTVVIRKMRRFNKQKKLGN